MFLKKAEMETAYMSCGIYGFSGSGKSFGAACICIGLHAKIASKGPVAYVDTEGGSDFLLPHYAHNNIEVVRSKSRAFADIIETMDEAIGMGCEILVVDSCTHLWRELCDAYAEKYHRKNGLQFQDWKNLKDEWGQFMTAILNKPLHSLLVGRAGYDYDWVDIEGDGKKTLIKTGTKMKAEGETEYEPSITLEMEQVTLTDAQVREIASKTRAGITTKVSGQFSSYRIYILKDRANMLTGSVFEFEATPGQFIRPENPVFASLLPFVNTINLGGAHSGVESFRTSKAMFQNDGASYTENQKIKTILLEEVEAELKVHYGQSKDDKTALVSKLKELFGTASWTAIQNMTIDKVRAGHDKLMVGSTGDPPAPPPGMDADTLARNLENIVPTPPRLDTADDFIGPLEKLYAKPLILRDDLTAAVNIAGYDLMADPKGVVPLLKSNKATDWKRGLGLVIEWAKEG